MHVKQGASTSKRVTLSLMNGDAYAGHLLQWESMGIRVRVKVSTLQAISTSQ